MRILLVTLLYGPDVSANAYAMTSLVEGLLALGHKVTVLAGMPHYGADAIYEGFRGRLMATERRGRLCVRRLWVYVPRRRDSRIGKIASWLGFNLLVTLVVPFLRRHDVALTLPPPYTLGVTQRIVSLLRGVPYVYNVQDVYPDIGVQQGLMKEGALFWVLRRVEDWIYRGAAHITVIAESFRSNLVAKGVGPDKITVIPNSFDADLVKPEPRLNEFAKEFDLEDYSVVMYAGNVGDSLGITTLIDAARNLRVHPNVVLVVVGRGTALSKLEDLVEAAGVGNVRFLPFQRRDRLSQMYASSDVQLLVQRRGLSSGSAPTKLLSIMCAGRPVVASVDLNSETAETVRKSGSGVVVPPEDGRALAEAVIRLLEDGEAARRHGTQGREYVLGNHTREIVAERYASVLQAVVERGRG